MPLASCAIVAVSVSCVPLCVTDADSLSLPAVLLTSAVAVVLFVLALVLVGLEYALAAGRLSFRRRQHG